MFMCEPQSVPKNHNRMVANEAFENLAELALRGPMISVSLEPLKSHLTCKRLVADTDMKQAVDSWLRIAGTDVFCAGLQTLVP